MTKSLKKYNTWSEEMTYVVKYKAQHYIGKNNVVKGNISHKSSACSGDCGSACGSSCDCAGPCS